MKGVDTNILIYAHRGETPQHKIALELITSLAQGDDLWFIAWPGVYEFIRVVTHPKIFSPPSSLKDAMSFLSAVAESPGVRMIGHGIQHWDWINAVIFKADARSNLAFDAQIAALFFEHGVGEIITSDGDFLRFQGLRVTNPFL